MNTQTAAALRALEQEMRNSFWSDTPTIAEWVDRIAAVLTQEGAETGDPERYFMDHEMIHDRKTGQHISTDEQTNPGGTNELFGRLRSYERMVHDYPKLSEFFSKHALGLKLAPSCFGCGGELQTWDGATRHLELPDVFLCDKCATACKGRNWYAEYRVAQEHAEQIDDLCVANARALFRALHPGEPYDEIEREQSHDITCEAANRILQPTAPAEGTDLPVEPPRGGVTEAMWQEGLEEALRRYPESEAAIIWISVALGTPGKITAEHIKTAFPPAAQAQDAGPNWKNGDRVEWTNELGNTFAGTLETSALVKFDSGGWRTFAPWDLKDLRALAAKEAK